MEKKTVVTILREIIVESASSGLSSRDSLQVVELLREIVNTNFSETSVRRALAAPSPVVRKYVEKFLQQVKEQT